MQMQSVQDLMVTGLTYVLDFEDKVSKAAPQISEACADPELKELFQKTATKSQEYGKKVEQVFSKMGREVQRNDNHVAMAMITEMQEMIKNTQEGPVRDAALIVAANQQQMYRVASYGSLESYAKLIGKQDAAAGLKENLEDSKGGDKKFTDLGESKINQQAAQA